MFFVWAVGNKTVPTNESDKGRELDWDDVIGINIYDGFSNVLQGPYVVPWFLVFENVAVFGARAFKEVIKVKWDYSYEP